MFSATKIPGGAATILGPTGCGPDVAQVEEIPVLNQIAVDITLDDTDERVEKVIALLRQYGKHDPLVARNDVFTEEELQSAPLLRMVGDANIRAFAAPLLGTKFDMNDACPICGTGARQTSSLYVDISDLPTIRKNRAILAVDGGPLVDGGLEKKLLDAGVTGISFGDVYARLKNKNRTLVARQQMIATHTMPPVSRKSTLNRSKECTKCHRGGVNGISFNPFRLFYRHEDMADIRDVNLTWEWFGIFRFDGNVSEARFSTPDVLVTPKVMNIFREAGVKTFEWTPVFVED